MTMTSAELSSYRDQHFRGTRNEQEKLLRQSTTLYIGNMSFFTTEEQVFELFGKCGDVKRVVMVSYLVVVSNSKVTSWPTARSLKSWALMALKFYLLRLTEPTFL